MNLVLIGVGAIVLYFIVIAIAYRVKRRYKAKKSLKDNDYKITFL